MRLSFSPCKSMQAGYAPETRTGRARGGAPGYRFSICPPVWCASPAVSACAHTYAMTQWRPPLRRTDLRSSHPKGGGVSRPWSLDNEKPRNQPEPTQNQMPCVGVSVTARYADLALSAGARAQLSFSRRRSKIRSGAAFLPGGGSLASTFAATDDVGHEGRSARLCTGGMRQKRVLCKASMGHGAGGRGPCGSSVHTAIVAMARILECARGHPWPVEAVQLL